MRAIAVDFVSHGSRVQSVFRIAVAEPAARVRRDKRSQLIAIWHARRCRLWTRFFRDFRGQWSAREREADHYRRSVYLFARRNLPYPMFATSDRPSANTSCATRDSSTTAPQTLYLFNSSVTIDAARRLAERCAGVTPSLDID